MISNSNDILKSINAKKTPARNAVLDVFIKHSRPLSIKNILQIISIKSDESTLYRTVNFFVEKGLLKTIFIEKDILHYELNHNDDHHHLVCINCKKITDFHGCNIDSLVAKALSQNPEFKKVSTHSIELFGLCCNCA